MASGIPMLWSAFDREELAAGSLENVCLAPGAGVQATLADPSRPGLLDTPPIRMGPFARAIVSWNGTTPPGAWLELALRAGSPGRWTKFYPLAVWSSDPDGPRHSCPGHGDEEGTVDTDTLKLARTAERLQIRVRFHPGAPGASPLLTGLAAMLRDASLSRADILSPCRAPGLILDVPPRSQRAFPEGARSWCSPTCVTMLLAFWERRLGCPLADPVPTAVRLTWDSAYAGAGNWPFNTAYASSKGMRAYVAQLQDLAAAEAFLRRGVPLALSIGWKEGELPGAPLPASSGHLVVLRGFDEAGDPVVNDPAAPEAEVRTVYPRTSFERAWRRHSGGAAYVIEP